MGLKVIICLIPVSFLCSDVKCSVSEKKEGKEGLCSRGMWSLLDICSFMCSIVKITQWVIKCFHVLQLISLSCASVLCSLRG